LASKAQQFREHWADELDGAAMYRALAERAHGEQREIFLELARAEERHAAHWAAKLVSLGEPEPRPEQHRRGPRVRLVAWLARRFGTRAPTPATTTVCPTPPRPWPPTSASTPGSWPG
jgi:hypothetical protein